MKGEAGKYPTLRQQDLHIVAVGSARREGENAADELLRQLITLPRPVSVEFAKTAPATTGPSSPPTSAPESSKNGQQPLQQNKTRTTPPPLPVNDAHLRIEKEQNEREGKELEEEHHGGQTAVEPLFREEAGDRETGATLGGGLPSKAGGGPQGEKADHHDDARALVASEDDDEESRRRDAPRRPPPQRHGTLPSAGWQEGRVDVVGVGVGNDGSNVGQRPQGAGNGDLEKEPQEKPDHYHDNGGAQTTNEEEKQGHAAPRRPQRHGTLPEGIDWEENLRSGRGGAGDSRTTTTAAAATAAQSVGDEESEGNQWSAPEEAHLRASPTGGSNSSPRSFYGANARLSHLLLTPDGSESSAWSNGRMHADGVDSIQRWLQVRKAPCNVADRFLLKHRICVLNLLQQRSDYGTIRASALSRRDRKVCCSARSRGVVRIPQYGHDAFNA